MSDGNKRDPLVQVAVAENIATADMIRDGLQATGIRALIKNIDPLSTLTGGGFGGLPYSFEIYVLESDAAAADVVLGKTAPPKRAQLPSGRHTYRRRDHRP